MDKDRPDPEEPRRLLIPQFSIRWLLGVTTAAAGVFSIVAMGVQGRAWAVGVSVAFLSIVVLALVYVAAFAMVWLFSVVTSSFGGRRDEAVGSPFALPPSKPAASNVSQ